MANSAGAASQSLATAPEALNAVREHLQRIRFGSISLTIHDGKIVQLDVTEKKRLAT